MNYKLWMIFVGIKEMIVIIEPQNHFFRVFWRGFVFSLHFVFLEHIGT
jgi:hypothetical protein